jgi:CheY-like chemotaxis protein
VSHARKVVAIVDDEEAVRRALRRLFRAQGIDTESFSSGARFLRSLDVCRPDCLILGRHIPEAGGLDVLLRMAAADLRIPVIVLAGRATRRCRSGPGLARVLAFPGAPASSRLVRKQTSRLATRRDPPGNRKTS